MNQHRKRALPVNQVFAYRLRDARKSKLWNQQQLADAMRQIGHPMSRVTIVKIEAGAKGAGGEVLGPEPEQKTRPRPVSLEEAVAFAVALDVMPQSLFLPIFPDEHDVLLAGKPGRKGVRVDVETAHAWAGGERPLKPENEQFYRFQMLNRPNRQPVQKATAALLEALGVLDQEPTKEN